MIKIIFTLCLFTNVKPSDIAELQVQKVRQGENVTIQCNHATARGSKNGLVWYKQSLGVVPQYVVRTFEHDAKYRFARGFDSGRFNLTVDEDRFDLLINEVKDDDIGTYFCGKGKSNVVEFGSGTLLLFEGEHTVHRLAESNSGIIYTPGNRSGQCKNRSEAGSATQSCIYKLPKRNLSLSDAGTFYCAIAACDEAVFENYSNLEITGDVCADQMNVLKWLSISRVGVLVGVIMVLYSAIVFKYKHLL